MTVQNIIACPVERHRTLRPADDPFLLEVFNTNSLAHVTPRNYWMVDRILFMNENRTTHTSLKGLI